jgi:hypothetical protein
MRAMIGRGFTVTIMSPIWAASNTNHEQFEIDGVLRAESDTQPLPSTENTLRKNTTRRSLQSVWFQ